MQECQRPQMAKNYTLNFEHVQIWFKSFYCLLREIDSYEVLHGANPPQKFLPLIQRSPFDKKHHVFPRYTLPEIKVPTPWFTDIYNIAVMAGNDNFKQKSITQNRKKTFLKKKMFVLSMAHGAPILAQLGPKN